MRLEPGVSHELARERAARVSDLRYALRFSLPGDRTVPVAGEATLTFTLTHADTPLALDFAPDTAGHLEACSVNGATVEPAIDHEHVVLPAHALMGGANTVRLTFAAGDAPLNRRNDYLYTVFVPARAREAFPCFDQPDLKARWTLTLDLPDDWVAVANADVTDTSFSSGRTTLAFRETAPLPTYLFAFAAGRFLEDVAERDGRELRIYHTSSDAWLLESNRESILDGHAHALTWMQHYTGIDYPFGKFDIVLLPAFQFGGMEHPGAIFYNSSHLLLTSSATRQHLLARAHVIAHETAHMWFGDLVTMTWFDDVWMKEVFANFMAAKIVNPEFPELDHDLRFLHAHYPAAYDVDRTAGTHPIRQPLDNLNDAGSLYGAVIYLKSPVAMRQLELMLGDEALREALREYLSRFAFAHASWPDLLDILAAHGPVDVHAWSHDWLDQAGRPSMRSELIVANSVVTRFALHTLDRRLGAEGVPASPLRCPQQLQVAIGRGGVIEHVAVRSDIDVEMPSLTGEPVPDFVLPNGRGLGYGDFQLDERSRAWLTAHLPDVTDALTRGSAWLTLWDEMLRHDLTPGAALDLAMRSLPRETSELNLQRILHYTERLFWTFHAPVQREAIAARLETVLLETLACAVTPGAKAAIFACLREVSTQPSTVNWLRALWNGEAVVDGLPLDEADAIAIVCELAVRHEDGDELVRQQLARTLQEDRRGALAFVAPALSSNEAERDRFFATIADAANRRREPWVIEGLRWLHHPLRAQNAVKYLRPGLELLQEVKRTGDIFLPKRWVDALLAGHRSPEAAQIVRAFLDSRPADYPAALRRIVLASADYLFRC